MNTKLKNIVKYSLLIVVALNCVACPSLLPVLAEFEVVAQLSRGTKIGGLAYGKKTWVAMPVGQWIFGNLIYADAQYSVDNGSSWESAVWPRRGNWSGITYGDANGGLFVTVSADADGSQVATSADGKTWTLRTTPSCVGPLTSEQQNLTLPEPVRPPCHWSAVTYGNGRFVAVASGGSHLAMTSSDGIQWTLQDVGFRADSAAFNAITFGNGNFVAIGGTGLLIASVDGMHWTPLHVRQPSFEKDFTGIAYGEKLFVALGPGPFAIKFTPADAGSLSVLPSDTPEYPGLRPKFNSITFGGGFFVATSDRGIYSSRNAVDWTQAAPKYPYTTGTAVGYGNRTFLVASHSHIFRALVN